MPTITFNGESFTVDHAAKGADYIHGYDADGVLVVSFDGITDFSGFTYNGTYMEPEHCLAEGCNDVKHVDGGLKKADGTPLSPADYGAAPSGYGLGGQCTEVTDWNTATATGFYWGRGTADNAPFSDSGFSAWGYTVSPLSTDAFTQVAFTYAAKATQDPVTGYYQRDGLSQQVRYFKGGAWSEWEWVNPPMQPGVEYRTTERWNGNPVYRKLVEYTNSAAIGGVMTISVPHGVSGVRKFLKADCYTDYYFLPYVSSATSLSLSEWDSTYLYMYNGSSSWGAGRKWYIDVRYVKTL